MRYSHTNIIAENWKSLSDFYIKVFECKIKPPLRNQSGLWLEKGTGVREAALEGVHLLLPGYGENGPTLEIFTYSQTLKNEIPVANKKGLRHLAFEVEDLAHTIRLLKECGGNLMGESVCKAIEGAGIITFVYAADPEGNILEIQSWD